MRLVAKWEVESDLPPVALTAHVDTLGAVVKEIKSNGRLKLSRIGGIQWPTVETEGVWVFTSKGEKIRGSVLIDTASGHIYGAAGSETPRNDEHMEVRLDARTTSEKETRALGNQHWRLRGVRSARRSDEWIHPLAVSR